MSFSNHCITGSSNARALLVKKKSMSDHCILGEAMLEL